MRAITEERLAELEASVKAIIDAPLGSTERWLKCAQFSFSARETVPALIAEVRRLQAVVKQQRSDVAAQCASIASLVGEERHGHNDEQTACLIAERILREFGLEP